ncbi:DUF4139 domain-containing protein [Psychroserpens sp.]|uniref:DUF4139 domain-containing protein n=1 Tax=Psychroserpens sp. TaxID=2020870 RepID=UPI0039E3F70D
MKCNVSEAGWFPIYDIKADKINEPLQLSYKAQVYQNTGTDWNDIKLTLSTRRSKHEQCQAKRCS